MRYDDKTRYIMFETKEEVDSFFAPFDRDDEQMPSWMYHNGFRYAREDAYYWLVKKFGENRFHLNKVFDPTTTGFGILFDDRNDALRFKLIWNLDLARCGYAEME